MIAYTATRMDRRDEIRGYLPKLRANGIEVNSCWVKNDEHLQEQPPAQALCDWDGIQRADMLMLFTQGTANAVVPARWARGGMMTEFGIALQAKKILVVIGPRINVFHELSFVSQFDNIDAFCEEWNG